MMRKRRTATNEPILPLHGVPDTRYMRKIRRKKQRLQWPILKSTLACLSLSILTIFATWNKIHLSPVHVAKDYRVLSWLLRDQSVTRNHAIKRRHIITENPKTVECGDGTLGYQDDDYCDCVDGRDEPNTAACSNILIQVESFQCHNNRSISIYASRVHDGIRDCPDGSDEL